MEQGFIFHDPTGRRWVRFRWILQLSAALAVVALVLLALSLLTSPQLPTLGLASVAHVANFTEVRAIIGHDKAAKNVPYSKLKYVRSASPVIYQRTAAKIREDQPLVFGYYVNWDPASMVSLRLNLSRLTHLVPEWFVLANQNGDITDESDPTVIKIAADAHLPVLAMLTNFRNGWQGGDLHKVLNNAAHRADLIENIYSNLIEHKFAGINVDFEQLSRHDRPAMVRFMTELKARLAPAHLLVTEAVPADDDAYDLKALGEIDDYIVPMVYDEHYQSGVPGPIASISWFDGQLDALAKVLPPEKTVIGFGNYGYDWVIGDRGSTEVTFADVIAAAQQNRAAVVWDKDEANPVLRYTRDHRQHEVWFLDAVTALNEAGDVSDAGFRGLALWRLGGEDPGLWTVLKEHRWPDNSFQSWTLFELTANKSVSQYGEGDVLRIVETPHDGKRNVWRRPDDDYEEHYEQYPSYYVVEASGMPREKHRKLVSLSFDDGPDPVYTPRVLDVLKAKQVSATFFVIGVNAEGHPDLLKREYQEGHLIGNHTYSHPNIATTSEESTARQLTATQRLIEFATGHSTTLFRPPYNADSEPQTPAEILPILRAQNLHYVTIGERIDPQDWRPGITADQIVQEVANEAESGHLILLHDAGGDRTATIEALPRIIDTLRARGFEFVSLADLIGKPRNELMPLPSAGEQRWAVVEGQALDTKGRFKIVIGVLFLVAIYLTLARSLVFGALAVVQKIRARRRTFDPNFHPSVSVIIAAYNEEKVIARTVRSILENGYRDLEILVVDDGSKDGTLQVLETTFEADPKVRIFTQPNHGKAAALNHAIRQARHEILVAVDADTIFGKGAIAQLIRHFSEPRVGAVSGNARVGNRRKWITRFQSIEYVCGFNLDRRALDLLNAITVVPGAVGAWRKSPIEELGGFAHDTLAEDADLTLAIRELGYEIRYEESAVAFTEAPESTRALARQRFRWSFGTLQAAWKHRGVTLDPRYGFLGLVAMPGIWLFQVLLAAVSPFAEAAMVIALFAGNWKTVLLFYLAFFVLESLTALLAYGLEGEKPVDLMLFPLQRLYFRALMQYVLVKSLLFAVKGRMVGWGKLERTATVQEA
jgi:cellulose synthase/poly-beta-1,6-N-acetylglucosamine synthase-like glycosyltransferase/spore germination protein YaaH/peptidoglycan/xylan/chitin deacetylase (PgdA/CDA1 family)